GPSRAQVVAQAVSNSNPNQPCCPPSPFDLLFHRFCIEEAKAALLPSFSSLALAFLLEADSGKPAIRKVVEVLDEWLDGMGVAAPSRDVCGFRGVTAVVLIRG
ncbi:hypothetical protein EJB05_34212, partial [Eragrostis curvula]